ALEEQILIEPPVRMDQSLEAAIFAEMDRRLSFSPNSIRTRKILHVLEESILQRIILETRFKRIKMIMVISGVVNHLTDIAMFRRGLYLKSRDRLEDGLFLL